jgi:predicted GNAT family N-acyltransferase
MVSEYAAPETAGSSAAESIAGQFQKKISVRRVREDELHRAIRLLREKLPAAAASDEAIRNVRRRNPDSVWGIYREGEENLPDADILGFFCMLHLTAEGARLIAEDALDTANPDPRFLIEGGERPSAIYYWAIVAEGLTIPAGPMIIIAMGPNYADVPIYVRPTTEAGLKRVLKSDYKPLVPGKGGMGHLFAMPRYPHLDKLKEMLAPRITAQPLKPAPRITVKVASTPAEMEMALRIRAVYLIEQNCPYEEEYDGNDYVGTTLIGFVDGEPAGTLRIRYFAEFVKFERMTVLPRFRGRSTVAFEIVRAAVAFCARKGFRKGYGHAQLRALKFWQRFGFRPMTANRKLVFSDHEYVEIEGDFSAHERPITIHSDPYVILRPEGRWDEAGVLDHSAGRLPTNPH